ncbi:MAG: PD-(D/E)XK nuclease family protein [Methanoregula sp.]|nr:PD-(D/E)XK nuclease family protein [Methanoregula sp.]
MSVHLGRSRIEWLFTALSVTGDAIAAGGLVLSSGLWLSIVSDPLAIPAETGRVSPSLLVVPGECAGKSGTWSGPQYSPGPERVKVKSVSELEKKSERVSAPGHTVSKYLPGIDGTLKGTIIHEVLRGRDARVVCAEYGVTDPLAVSQCEEIVARFRSSELMQRVKRSFCEQPFVVTVSGVRVTGSIDRLGELLDGSWIVIDYKSDPVSCAEYALKAEEYALSLSVYCEAARQLVGAGVVGWLYFTETGEFFLKG